jgi:hypothetical protein
MHDSKSSHRSMHSVNRSWQSVLQLCGLSGTAPGSHAPPNPSAAASKPKRAIRRDYGTVGKARKLRADQIRFWVGPSAVADMCGSRPPWPARPSGLSRHVTCFPARERSKPFVEP